MKTILIVAFLFTTSALAATPVQRYGAIADALVDGTATIEQKTRVADSFVAHFRNEIIEMGFDPDSLTNAQKSLLVVRKMKQFVRDIALAQAGEADATAKAAREQLDTALEAAQQQAEADWPEE